MREIKFRAWNEVEEKMLNWNEFLDTNMKNTFIAPESTGLILMQYTGLKDKNGKEIYEGDIVKIKNENLEIICEIIYLDTAFRTKKFVYGSYYDCLYYWYANDFEIEVIGNIYDNSNFLEEGE